LLPRPPPEEEEVEAPAEWVPPDWMPAADPSPANSIPPRSIPPPPTAEDLCGGDGGSSGKDVSLTLTGC